MKAEQQYLQDLAGRFASDREALRAIQQVLATAIKHSAREIRVALVGQVVRTEFILAQGVSAVELGVSPERFVALLLNNGQVVEVGRGRLNAVARIPFRSLMVDFRLSFVSNGENSTEEIGSFEQFCQQYFELRLEGFEVGFPLPDSSNGDVAKEVEEPVAGPSYGREIFHPKRESTLALAAESASPPTAIPETRGDRLLVIDDDVDQRAILKRVFELAGYEVELAADGIDGILTAARKRPSVIVVDFMMPEMDGRETIRRLRSNPQTARIPIVALTAYADSEVEHGMLDAGADDFCSKSISKKVLLKRIARLIKPVTTNHLG